MGLAGQARLEGSGVSAREAETLAAVGQRLSNREIADRMFISVRTVESHVSSLLRKLGLPDRAALVRLAQQLPGEQPLPVSSTSFVGRDDELTELSTLLTAGPLVSVVGPAGCGKTRLALEAARRWPGEARMADLSQASGRDVSTLLAAGIGVGYEARDLVAAARIALSGGSLLLVVDNCEHVIGEAGDLLGALARGVPGLHVLITSREPLGVDAERVLSLQPLEPPSGPGPQDVRASAAGQLFLDRASAASARFGLDEATAPYVSEICGQLDGLPLAIELAAARVRNLSVMELADGLQQHLGMLERPGRTGRHKSLSSAIGWSWLLLDDSERGVLRRLAVLPGEFTLALAEATIGDRDGQDLRSCLMRLVEQSLVSMRLPEAGPARYWLLGVIRTFVLGRPDPIADEQVAKAHARYFANVATDAVRARLVRAPAARPATGVDEANLLAALAWSAEHDPGLADRLLTSVSELAEAEPTRQVLELIRDVASLHPAGLSSEALARAAIAVSYLSLDDAERLARASADAAASERDRAYARWARGWMYAYRRAESAAQRELHAVVGYARSAADPWLEGSALQASGVSRERPQDAFADWEQAVVRFALAGDPAHANNVRYMLAGLAVESRSRLEDVPVWLDECESYATASGFTHELAHARLVRASYQRLQGDVGAARKLLDAALPVFRQAGDFRCITRSLLELAQPGMTDDPANALPLVLQCLRAAVIASGPAMHARVLARLMSTSAAAGDLALAARCLGALDALGKPPEDETAQALERTLRRPGYATFVAEGSAGGIDLIASRYQR